MEEENISETTREKEIRIENEKQRLMELFKDVPASKLKMCNSLIERTAFITISMEDLEALINEQGYVERLEQGSQKMNIESKYLKSYIALGKNLSTIMKDLYNNFSQYVNDKVVDELEMLAGRRRTIDG